MTLFFSFFPCSSCTTKWRYWASSEHVICVRFIPFWMFWTLNYGRCPDGSGRRPDGSRRFCPDGSGRLLVRSIVSYRIVSLQVQVAKCSLEITYILKMHKTSNEAEEIFTYSTSMQTVQTILASRNITNDRQICSHNQVPNTKRQPRNMVKCCMCNIYNM